MQGVEIAIDIFKRKKEIFENYREIARKVKEASAELLGDKAIRVIVFGSVVRGNYTPLSDLDLLIISRKAFDIKYGKFVEKLESKLGKELLGVEIHLVTPEIFENWYKKFIDVYEEV